MNPTPFCPVTKLEKLLVATDCSEYSEGAIREAMNFAKQCASRLYIMTVVESNLEYQNIASNVSLDEENTMNHLLLVQSNAAKEGVACEAFLRKGRKPHQLIVEEAVNRNVDMIILGRHGRRGLMKLLVGQVSAKVIGDAPCKVLIVPKAAGVDFSNILVATDGSNHSIAASAAALEIAKRCGSKIFAISAALSKNEMEEAQTNVNKVAEMAQAEGITVEPLTATGKPCEIIVKAAISKDIGLIVVGTYGREGIKKLLMGSTTEKVIGLADCAILVARA